MAKKQVRVPNYSGGMAKAGGIMLTWGFLRSVAFNSLTPFQLQMFIYLLSRLKLDKVRIDGKKVYRATNNGQLNIAHKTFKRDLKTNSNGTIVTAQNHLIKVGIIKLTREGSANVSNRYKILYAGNSNQICKTSEERWRKYPEKNWESEINRKPHNLVGSKTRWKKGQCGNPNYQNHPSKVDYSQSNGVDYSNSDSLKKWTDVETIEDIP